MNRCYMESADEPVPMWTINDVVWGNINIPKIYVQIIDTKQFQRLRKLKQLGGVEYVYPGAVHTRFEHSIGTCYVAGLLLDRVSSLLPPSHPKLDLTDFVCVQIAALCHDLGHGPLSHFYDLLFVPYMGGSYKHEEGSAKMFDLLLKENPHVKQALSKPPFSLTKLDFDFIQELIVGTDLKTVTAENWPFKGRGHEKSILYEIVSNHVNGIDVDKWDYFLRDAHHCGLPQLVGFNIERFMNCISVRISKKTKLWTISQRVKGYDNVREIWFTRAKLHKNVYQHRVSRVVEIMLMVALEKADKFIKVKGENGKLHHPSECGNDMVALSQLTDQIFNWIENYEMFGLDPQIESARSLLRAIDQRKFFKLIGRTMITESKKFEGKGINKDLAQKILGCYDATTMTTTACGISRDDIVVGVFESNCGKGTNDPLDDVCFFDKNSDDVKHLSLEPTISSPCPYTFAFQTVLAYIPQFENSDAVKEKQRCLADCFAAWCKKDGHDNLLNSEAESPQKRLKQSHERQMTPPPSKL